VFLSLPKRQGGDALLPATRPREPGIPGGAPYDNRSALYTNEHMTYVRSLRHDSAESCES